MVLMRNSENLFKCVFYVLIALVLFIRSQKKRNFIKFKYLKNYTKLSFFIPNYYLYADFNLHFLISNFVPIFVPIFLLLPEICSYLKSQLEYFSDNL